METKEELRAEIARLKYALAYYAHISNYDTRLSESAPAHIVKTPQVMYDLGAIARKALDDRNDPPKR